MILDEQAPIPRKENEEQVTLRGQRDHHSIPITRAIIIDPNPITRGGLFHLLADTNFHVIAEYPSLDKLDDEVVASKNCIMLVTNEESNSARTLSQIAYWKQSHAQLRIIVLSNRFDLSVALDAIKVGALGYLLNSDITRDILLRSMELVLLGVVIFSPKLLDALQTHILGGISSQHHRVSSQSPNTESNIFPMTISHRERLILSLLTRGASNKHIAKELGIAEATVKVHVKHILRKTRVRNRTQAAMWALENNCGGYVEAT